MYLTCVENQNNPDMILNEIELHIQDMITSRKTPKSSEIRANVDDSFGRCDLAFRKYIQSRMMIMMTLIDITGSTKRRGIS